MLGIGCDLADVERIEKAIARKGFKERVFTPEEIAASDLRVALIGEMIKAREAQGVTQRDMEKLSGVAQPVIARMEM